MRLVSQLMLMEKEMSNTFRGKKSSFFSCATSEKNYGVVGYFSQWCQKPISVDLGTKIKENYYMKNVLKQFFKDAVRLFLNSDNFSHHYSAHQTNRT